jgi:hypothetical protein
MNYKVNNLKDKIYQSFIRGEFGAPKIPSDNEVMQVIDSMTDRSYTPITEKGRLPEFDYVEISGRFYKIIDDIEILFDSIEDESQDILDQLTSSIKEHNGVKRELRRIRSRTSDIVNRKLGEEYLQYNFTESFDDINYIDTLRSDPIDTDAGVFTILSSSSQLLSLPHYRDRKLEFNIIEAFSTITEYGYIGDNNSTNILSKGDPKSITYRAQTVSPSRLRIVLPIQLLPDGSSTEINAVGISLDSSITKGFIRLFYQDNYQWKDVPALSLQEIKGDNVVFSFPTVPATHIKFEFIKDYPDVPGTNEYLLTIYEIAISKASNRSSAKLYSKPIVLDRYSTETPVIHNVSCTVDADVPDGCSVKVFVARDTLLSGQFVDSAGLPVYADSIEAVNFDPLSTGTVYLSDVWAREGLSGIDPYQGFDFDWKEVKPSESFGNSIPEVIEFNNTTTNNILDNSLFQITDWYTFGDSDYAGPWPQYPAVYGDIFISGWCNTSNSQWSPILEGAVESGWFIQGVDVASILGIPYWNIEDSEGNINPSILLHPLYSGQWLGYGNGYPFAYYVENRARTLRFGEYAQSINGWWRPYSFSVKPSGISEEYASGDFLDPIKYGETSPDFYFNGIKFYKIYKFGYTDNVIDSSIKLFSYETRPIGSDSDYFDHNFVWKYRSSWSIETQTYLDAKDTTHLTASGFSDYLINLPILTSSNEYNTINGISEIRLHNTNVVFSDTDYIVKLNSDGTPSGILFRPLDNNYPYLRPEDVSFDITYNTRIKNAYSSTWVAFAIVSPKTVGEISLTNPFIWERYAATDRRVIDKVIIEDLDSNNHFESKDQDGKINFQLDASSSETNKHFKITIFCAADEATGFSARYSVFRELYFIPSENIGLMKVSKGVRFVSRIDPIKLVDFSTLIYDTPMSNDKRCAIISDYNDEKYIVSKVPSKDIFPGYYFDSISGYYYIDNQTLIKNKSHFIRRSLVGSEIIYYTTGSSGISILDGRNQIDGSWNDGNTLPEFPNTVSNGVYPIHSTYGYPINLEDSSTVLWTELLASGDYDLLADERSASIVGTPAWEVWLSGVNSNRYNSWRYSISWFYGYERTLMINKEPIFNRGFLFYNTAENLPSFYSISYKTVKTLDDSYSRFVYKIELESNGGRTVVPKIRSVNFRINRK